MVRFSFDGGASLLLGALAGQALGCAEGDATELDRAPLAAAPAPLTRSQPLARAEAHPGKQLFERPFEGSNGRSCATCHVLDESTTLRPESVARRLAQDPADPLFHPLDADDPNAATLSFEHLKRGLVRVGLSLADNLDVIDLEGNVVTPDDRMIFVWRGVPSVADTALTAPYQLDGRQPTLEAQAQAAVTSHSQGPELGRRTLQQLADFQRQVFSSPRAWFVSQMLDYGLPLAEVPIPEKFAPLSPQEERGRKVYDLACQACHGSATTDRIVDRAVHDFFFAELKPDGNVRFELRDGKPVAVPLARPNDEFLNVGFGFGSYLGQVGLTKTFTSDVELPRIRLRFYTDGTRQTPVVDLPPVPVTESGDPLQLRARRDENGAPIVGPNRQPQLFSTDPGRAILSGDPADFEAFDVTPLRGIAGTAPYYHDNSMATLEEVVDSYSRFLLGFITPLRLPPLHPPEQPNLPPESLGPDEKQDLVAFLRRL